MPVPLEGLCLDCGSCGLAPRAPGDRPARAVEDGAGLEAAKAEEEAAGFDDDGGVVLAYLSSFETLLLNTHFETIVGSHEDGTEDTDDTADDDDAAVDPPPPLSPPPPAPAPLPCTGEYRRVAHSAKPMPPITTGKGRVSIVRVHPFASRREIAACQGGSRSPRDLFKSTS